MEHSLVPFVAKDANILIPWNWINSCLAVFTILWTRAATSKAEPILYNSDVDDDFDFDGKIYEVCLNCDDGVGELPRSFRPKISGKKDKREICCILTTALFEEYECDKLCHWGKTECRVKGTYGRTRRLWQAGFHGKQCSTVLHTFFVRRQGSIISFVISATSHSFQAK